MASLWFNVTGILHDGIGLVLCDTCPCVADSVVSDSCTSSTCVTVDCCPSAQIPIVLTVTVTGGSCPQTSTATYDGVAWRKDGPGALTIDLSCTAGVWVISVDFDSMNATVVCDPFNATADFTGTVCGDITVTFTE